MIEPLSHSKATVNHFENPISRQVIPPLLFIPIISGNAYSRRHARAPRW